MKTILALAVCAAIFCARSSIGAPESAPATQVVPLAFDANVQTKIETAPEVQVLAARAYAWKPVAMGGVEYATGLIINAKHPGEIYLRADGGGVWRWEREKRRWKNLSDQIGWNWGSLITADSVALDANDSQTLYVAGGGGQWSDQHDILKSTDGGQSWARLGLKNQKGEPIYSGGNDTDKQGGERLIVDPNNSLALWFGTRRDGLWQSNDGGQTWKPNATFPNVGGFHTGVQWVALDWQHSPDGAASPLVFAAAHAGEREINGQKTVMPAAIYRSTDAGATWQELKGGPDAESSSLRGVVLPDGSLLATCVGPSGGIWKWQKNQWQNLTPPDAKGQPFGGIDFDHKDPQRLIAAQTYGENGVIWSSSDGGAHWQRYAFENRNTGNLQVGVYPAWEKVGDWHWGGNASDVRFDPINPKQVFFTSFSGPHLGRGIGEAIATFDSIGEGREQMTCADVVSPSQGAPLISGVWDVGGFRHENLRQIPPERLQLRNADGSRSPDTWQDVWQDIFDLDAAPSNPNVIVAAGGWLWNNSGDAAISTDNGRVFKRFAAKPFGDAKFGRIAVSTDANNIVWAPMGDDAATYFTRDGGQSWTPCAGLGRGLVTGELAMTFFKCLAADRVTPNLFYVYERKSGRFLSSKDGGATWQHTATLPTQPGNHWDFHRLEAAPNVAGEVWLALQEHGLLRSRDGGTTWTKIGGVQWAQNLGFGKGVLNGPGYSIYLFGQIGGAQPKAQNEVEARLYRSDDGGRNWVQVNDEAHKFGQIAAGLTGDNQIWGRVYVTTGTRGIWVGETVGTLIPLYSSPGRKLRPLPLLPIEVENRIRSGKRKVVIPRVPPPPCPYYENLIVNPGAELGPGSPDGSQVVDPVPGWARYRPATVIGDKRPGVPPKFFAGGPGNWLSEFLQGYTLISTCEKKIDRGGTGFQISGFFGGKERESDNAALLAEFYGPLLKTGDPEHPSYYRPFLGSVVVGPVLAPQRAFKTLALPRFLESRVPRGTRIIHWILGFSAEDTRYNNGTADDLSFVLNLSPPRDAPDPIPNFLLDGDPSNGEAPADSLPTPPEKPNIVYFSYLPNQTKTPKNGAQSDAPKTDAP